MTTGILALPETKKTCTDLNSSQAHVRPSMQIYGQPLHNAMLILVLQARGKEAQRGVAYHQRLLPAHTQLKTR